MKVSELIAKLQIVLRDNGDLNVYYDSGYYDRVNLVVDWYVGEAYDDESGFGRESIALLLQ